MVTYDSGSLAWVMSASTAIMLMAPGVSFFFGGMVSKKNLLSIISFSFLIFSVSTITWGLVGFSLAFGSQTLAKGFIGDCGYCGLRYITDNANNPYSAIISLPSYFFLEMLYAGVAGVILTVPFVGRLRTIYLALIAISYQLIIYSPVNFWIRTTSGWMNKLGVIDFSGGAIVHLTSGFATAAVFYMIGAGKNQLQRQNSMSTVSTLIGTVLIWFASFGFNGAAALTSGTPAATALINTQLAAAGGVIGWAFTQYIVTDRAKVMGWCSGAVCGLVSITPCSGYVSLWSAIVIGASSSIIVYIYSHLNSESKDIPDTPGVYSCHGISAFWGIICAGAFATVESGNTYQGLFYGGARLFGVNILCAVVCGIYGFVVMLFIHFLTLRLVQPYLPQHEQQQGLDSFSHVQESDPLDEQDIVNIIRALHSYSEINKMMESNFEQEKPLKAVYEKSKFKEDLRNRRKSLQEPMPSRQKLMQKLHEIDRAKEQEMIKHYETTIKLKQKASQK